MFKVVKNSNRPDQPLHDERLLPCSRSTSRSPDGKGTIRSAQSSLARQTQARIPSRWLSAFPKTFPGQIMLRRWAGGPFLPPTPPRRCNPPCHQPGHGSLMDDHPQAEPFCTAFAAQQPGAQAAGLGTNSVSVLRAITRWKLRCRCYQAQGPGPLGSPCSRARRN